MHLLATSWHQNPLNTLVPAYISNAQITCHHNIIVIIVTIIAIIVILRWSKFSE